MHAKLGESKSPFKEFHLFKYGARKKNLRENHIILTERWYHSKSRPEIPSETTKKNREVKACKNLIFQAASWVVNLTEFGRITSLVRLLLPGDFMWPLQQALCLFYQIRSVIWVKHSTYTRTLMLLIIIISTEGKADAFKFLFHFLRINIGLFNI